ncbi:MAG: (d)CMP kinase [Gammaproteobacteria bacterium]|nr:(d)CMP kinase [Gammaproteobacteria bacterium]
MSIPVITIDGPSGSGKGSIAQRVATALGFHLLDSGALYRLTALAASKKGVSMQAEAELATLAAELEVEFVAQAEGEAQVLLAGEEVSLAIREEQCGMNASKIAALPQVRAALLQRQRNFCQAPGLVADGRDMGSVVFPQAVVKVFLTASARERANRRFLQLKARGVEVSLRALIKDIEERDARDINRSVAPLRPADDAVLLDSTAMSIEAVETKVLSLLPEF